MCSNSGVTSVHFFCMFFFLASKHSVLDAVTPLILYIFSSFLCPSFFPQVSGKMSKSLGVWQWVGFLKWLGFLKSVQTALLLTSVGCVAKMTDDTYQCVPATCLRNKTYSRNTHMNLQSPHCFFTYTLTTVSTWLEVSSSCLNTWILLCSFLTVRNGV